MDEIRVAELFAGVGGFHQGLKEASERFRVVFSNQWEPSTKTQDASLIYQKNFGSENHFNEDITKIPTDLIPEHDMLVGGFPCQDYSVARTLNQAAGLEGKKGVLWWEIYRIVKDKKPKFLFLENVDRLLKSPADQRGRDFAIMLASLSDLGYIIEWRVINAADYGMPQRRRRVFILAYRKGTTLFAQAKSASPQEWILDNGVFSETFPVSVRDGNVSELVPIRGQLDEISDTFNRFSTSVSQLSLVEIERQPKFDWPSPFRNAGMVIGRVAHTINTDAEYRGPRAVLGDVILTNRDVGPEYYIPFEQIERWEYLKGSKKEKRTNKATGFEYHYNEGPMSFPDPLDKPSRTIITAEGGASPSRFKHAVKANGRIRRLTPVELERLNMFPDGHTEGVSDIKRAFFMGNALVVGIIKQVGISLAKKMN